MSSPVFGREPSRPLPRDGDDGDPTLEIDLTDAKESDQPDGSDAAEREAAGDEHERDEPAADESEAVEREVASDEPGAEAVGEVASDEPAVDESGTLEPEVASDEPAVDESGAVQRGVASDEPVVEDGPGIQGAGERDASWSGEQDHPAESERSDEVAGLDVAELAGSPSSEPEASATRFDDQAESDGDGSESEVEPVVLDAEDVSAEPALGHPEPALPEPVLPEPVPVPAPDGPVAGGVNGFEGPWTELQLQFVDDPQSATAGALQLLRDALGGLSPDGASTEDLRVAFRRYRAAYHDLARN